MKGMVWECGENSFWRCGKSGSKSIQNIQMAPRGSRRQQYTDDYTDESDSSSCKKRRKEKVKEETELEPETKKPSMGKDTQLR